MCNDKHRAQVVCRVRPAEEYAEQCLTITPGEILYIVCFYIWCISVIYKVTIVYLNTIYIYIYIVFL